MGEDQAPPVVVVVVTSNPGPWFEECITALRGQDYGSFTMLVLDAASDEPLAPRSAAIAPEVYLHRLATNDGFGPSANTVTEIVDGSTYFLFCHDDVMLAPDALRRLVEEAFRSNAGIVAPKLVDYDEPDRILQIGLGVDRYAAPVRRVERLEFDQAQHDEARDVFAVPGACTLVRSDLFSAIGGFDPEISMFGEDIDLCWRARLAGAHVAVVPQAIVRHLEATSARRRPLPESRALQWRHELRAVLKNYGRTRRAVIVFQLVMLSLLEMVYFAAVGRRRRSREVFEAWRWNLAPARGLKQARESVMQLRRVSDHEVSALFTSRTSRIWRYVRARFEDVTIRWHRRRNPYLAARGGRPRPHREQRPRAVVVIATIAGVILVFGARSLLSGRLPLIGEVLPIPAPGHLLGNFFGGFTNAGMQRPGPSSPAFFFLGILGIVLFGAMGVLLKFGLIVAIVSGALGVTRLVRPFGPASARLGAALTYLFLPLAWNDLAHGDVAALVAYAGMPWVILRLVKASGIGPFSSGDGLEIKNIRTLHEMVWLGILLAVLGSFEPGIVLLSVFVALALFATNALLGEANSALRSVVVAVGGLLVAIVLCFPWSITFVDPGLRWSVLSGATASPSVNPSLSELLRFATGPLGAGLLGWAFLAAGIFVVLVGRDDRFSWAVRFWGISLSAVTLAWAANEGWLGAGGGAIDMMLAPFACCIAVLVGLGVATVLSELASTHFGWRHVAGVCFVLFALAGFLPVLGASVGGRFSMPSTGYDAVLSFTNPAGKATPSPSRILWLGDPRALPLAGWQIAPGLAYGVSDGLPDMTRLLPSANPGEATFLVRAVMSAQAGLTVRLGGDLAKRDIHYVIVPTAIAPVLPGEQVAVLESPPEALVAGLSSQVDLRELPAEGGALVFENTAWHAGRGDPPIPGGTPAVLRVLAVVFELGLWSAGGMLVVRRRRRARAQHARRSRPARSYDSSALEDARDRSRPYRSAGTR